MQLKVLAFAMLAASKLPAQLCTSTTGTCGQIAIYNNSGTLTFTTSGLDFADAWSPANNQMCLSIQKATGELPTTGGTIDARGFTGVQNCTGNPFANVHTRSLRLLLGAVTIQLSSPPLVIPSGVSVEGTLGVTIIQSTSSAAVPVVQFGASSGATDVGLKDVTVICNSAVTPGAIGVQNQNAGVRSVMERVSVQGCSDTGIEITTHGARNSGPIRDIYVTPPINPTAATTCARIGTPLAGCGGTGQPACTCTNCQASGVALQGLTCDASSAGSNTLAVGLSVNAQGSSIGGIFVSNVNQGIQIGNSSTVASSGLTISGVHGTLAGSSPIPVLVQLGPSSLPGFDASLFGLTIDSATPSGALTVNDQVSSPAQSESSYHVELYTVGALTGSSRVVFCAPKLSGCPNLPN